MKNSEYKEKFKKEVFDYNGTEFVFNKSDRIGLLSNKIWKYSEFETMVDPSWSSLVLKEDCICLIQHGYHKKQKGQECKVEYYVPFFIAWEFWQEIKKDVLERKKKEAFIELKANLRDLKQVISLPGFSAEEIIKNIERNAAVLSDYEGF